MNRKLGENRENKKEGCTTQNIYHTTYFRDLVPNNTYFGHQQSTQTKPPRTQRSTLIKTQTIHSILISYSLYNLLYSYVSDSAITPWYYFTPNISSIYEVSWLSNFLDKLTNIRHFPFQWLRIHKFFICRLWLLVGKQTKRTFFTINRNDLDTKHYLSNIYLDLYH